MCLQQCRGITDIRDAGVNIVIRRFCPCGKVIRVLFGLRYEGLERSKTFCFYLELIRFKITNLQPGDVIPECF